MRIIIMIFVGGEGWEILGLGFGGRGVGVWVGVDETSYRFFAVLMR